MIASLFYSHVPKFSDFIKKIRNCKTAAQEREIISEERTQIRDSLNLKVNFFNSLFDKIIQKTNDYD